jgi:23S rRNA (adenine1618-N6)-methyltransferase
VKPGLHPRNRHARRHDFDRLAAVCPDLGAFLQRAPHGGLTIDFGDPAAVRALNRALLAEAYGIRGWDLPPGSLCPPVPGRADYVHHLADLLAEDHAGRVPRGPSIRVLDVGVGASAIYPLIGHCEYGWSFVGSDVDQAALTAAACILAANPRLAGALELRPQTDRLAVFAGVVRPGERFSATMCNPPFHASAREASEAAREKWRKLGRAAAGRARNFGGRGAELWCEGGELGFLRRMVAQSADFAGQVRWFSALVSSSESLPALQRALHQAGARQVRTVPMAQGQKRSRFVAWSFLPLPSAADRSRRGLPPV